MKKTLVLVFILLLLSISAVRAGDLAAVQKAGVLQFGVSPDRAPFAYYDADDELTGIDIKLMEEAAGRMGLSLEVIEMSANDLIESLAIGQVDVIGGAFSKTGSRMNRIDFTNVYYIAEAVFVGNKGIQLEEPLAPESFSGKKIGVLKNSGFEEWVKTELYDKGFILKKLIYTYDKMDDAVKALDKGKIDLLMIENYLFEARYQSRSEYQVFRYGSIKDDYAFGVRKSSDLKAEINNQLSAMMKDGTAQQIADTFFLMDMQEEQSVIRWNQNKPAATPTPTPVMTMLPTSPLSFPSIPTGSPTDLPTAEVQQNCSHAMAFDADVTVPDGQTISVGSTFIKTWRIRNTGNCPWTQDFIFGFVSGTRMDGADRYLPSVVYPGDSVDISINLTAPSNPGSYQGNWQLKTPQGHDIGTPIWVQITATGAYSYPTSAPVYPAATSVYHGIATSVPIYMEEKPTATPFVVDFKPSYMEELPTATPHYMEYKPSYMEQVPTATPFIGKIKEPGFLMSSETPVVFEKLDFSKTLEMKK